MQQSFGVDKLAPYDGYRVRISAWVWLARGPQPFTREHPFYMNYHWLQFRAQGTTARLTVTDWENDQEPGGPVGQELMFNFIEIQPVFEPE